MQCLQPSSTSLLELECFLMPASNVSISIEHRRQPQSKVLMLAGSKEPEKESTLSGCGPGLESVAVRDWSTDEAYSEHPSGEGEGLQFLCLGTRAYTLL